MLTLFLSAPHRENTTGKDELIPCSVHMQVMLQPLEVNFDVEFFIIFMEFFTVLKSIEFRQKRVSSCLFNVQSSFLPHQLFSVALALEGSVYDALASFSCYMFCIYLFILISGLSDVYFIINFLIFKCLLCITNSAPGFLVIKWI